MTIPRNHVQRVILEDARVDQAVMQVQEEQDQRVVKRMSTNRIFVTEKPENNLGKVQAGRRLSASVLHELDQIEHEQLRKIFSEEFHLLKDIQPLYQQLLDRIVCDKSSMSYIKAVLGAQSERLVSTTGVGALELNARVQGAEAPPGAGVRASLDRMYDAGIEQKAVTSLPKLSGAEAGTRMG